MSNGRVGEPAGHATPGVDPLLGDGAPDYVDPVLGWRVWRVVRCKGQYLLASLFNNVVWVPGEALDARCFAIIRVPRHTSPDLKCHCGVYAARREAIDWDLIGRRALTPLVVGRVALWGPVVEAERGWRASFAYPRSLFVPFSGKGDPFDQFRLIAGLERYEIETELVDLGSLAPKLADIAKNI